jgi:hypothetical protein
MKARDEMCVSEIGPHIWPIPVIGIAVSELCSPSLHQADDSDDDNAGREHKQPAPFACGRKAARQSGQGEPELRPRLAESVQERCDCEQAKGQCKNIQHRDPRLHEHHLVEEGQQRGSHRRPLCCKQREAAQIHRHDRQRSKQHARIAPTQWSIAKAADRQRDQLLCQRRMHRIELRRRRRGLQHLSRRRHVMHLIEVEFIRRRHTHEKRKMRREEQDDGNNGTRRGRKRGNRR